MSSSSHSSNLSGNVNINNITNSGARLMMTHPLGGFSGGRVSQYFGDDGVTAGDAIRYNAVAYHATDNPSGGKYVKAKADVPENSEVIGIIESIDNVGLSGVGDVSSVVNIVISGQINYPDHRLINATHVFDFDNDDSIIAGASGGNDIYFLSEVTAGAIQNLAPIEDTKIAKPVLQKAPDGDFTGHVVNYIGYQVGGEIVSSEPVGEPDGTTVNVLNFGGNPVVPPFYYSLNGQSLSLNTLDPLYSGKTYLRAYNTLFGGGVAGGLRWLVSFLGMLSNDYGKKFTIRNSQGSVVLNGTLERKGKNDDTYTFKTVDSYTPQVGDVLRMSTGNNYTLTSVQEPLKVSVFLPKNVSSPSNLRLTNSVDNALLNAPYENYIKIMHDSSPTTESIQLSGITPNAPSGAVTIPKNVTINEATINSLKVKSDDGTIIATDVGSILKQLKDDMQTVAQKNGNFTPTVNNADIS